MELITSALTGAMQMPWEQWKHSPFGTMPKGTVFALEGNQGQGTYLVRVASWERIGDVAWYLLELVDRAAGNA